MSKIRTLILFCLAATLADFALAETYGTSSVMFLNENPSPRCFAMAGVCSNSVNDADAAFLNPGLLGHMTESAVSFSFWTAPDSIGKYGFANAVISSGQYGSFNLSFLGYNSGNEEFYDLSGNKYDLNLEKDYAFSGGWGIPFEERLFWGFKVKSVSSSLAESYKARTMTFATGMIYKSLDDFFSASLLLDNFGGSLNYRYEDEKLPTSVKAETGLRYQMRSQNLYFGVSAKKILRENFIEKSAGAEIELKNLPFSLRGGFKNSYNGSFFTAGFAVKFSGFRLDYASEFPDTFGNGMHRLGISFNFSPQRDRDRAQVYRQRDLREKAEKLAVNDLRNNEKSFINDRKAQNRKAVEKAVKEEKKEEKKAAKNKDTETDSPDGKENKKQQGKKDVYWQDWLLLP